MTDQPFNQPPEMDPPGWQNQSPTSQPAGWQGQPPLGQPAGYPGQVGMGPRPNNYLVWAILSTLFCCLPAGIVSIIQAAKVNGLYDSGNYAAAQAASESAKKWAVISAAVALVLAVLYFILIAAVGVSGGLETQ